MRVTPATVTGAIVLFAASSLMAQESLQERLQRMMAFQSQIAELHAQVVAAPDDRTLLRPLLETGLQYYELLTGAKFSDSVRKDLLDLKIVMQDMYAIERTVAAMGFPTGGDGADLARRLKSLKVPLSLRRPVPLVDPWGTPYRFFMYKNEQFKIVSAGRGKKFDTGDLGISEKELAQAPVRLNASMDDNIVFIDGRNFTRIFDYPKEAQSFLYTSCEPADALRLFRCW